MEKKTIVKNEIVKNGIHGYSAAETYKIGRAHV